MLSSESAKMFSLTMQQHISLHDALQGISVMHESGLVAGGTLGHKRFGHSQRGFTCETDVKT